MAPSAPPAPPAERSVVLVIGPGRSGTSTLAGALVRSGYQVPGLSIKGNPTNPTGFFEPRWVVNLHRSLLRQASVLTLDTSPHAYRRVARLCADGDVRSRVSDWLGARLEESPRLVVKDPRIVWFRDLWLGACDDLGARVGFATMLRHPAEVSSSRRRYYTKAEIVGARTQGVRSIAGWTNVALLTEQVSAGSPRAFVRYVDLVADWRSALTTVSRRLEVGLDPPPELTPHPVDDFIDPSLHRLKVDWGDLDVPAPLRDLAEQVWRALSGLAEEDAAPPAEALGELRERYAELLRDAAALTADDTRRRVQRARVRARRDEALRRRSAQPAAAAPQQSSLARAGSAARTVLARARARWGPS